MSKKIKSQLSDAELDMLHELGQQIPNQRHIRKPIFRASELSTIPKVRQPEITKVLREVEIPRMEVVEPLDGDVVISKFPVLEREEAVGVITKLFSAWGFIKLEGVDEGIYFSQKSCWNLFKAFRKNDKVTFRLYKGERGFWASNVVRCR